MKLSWLTRYHAKVLFDARKKRCGASVHDTELSHGISNPQLVHQTPQLLTEEWSGVTIKYVFTSHPCFVPLLCSFPRVISDVLQYNSKVAFLLWHITHLSSAIQSLFRGNIFVVRKAKFGLREKECYQSQTGWRGENACMRYDMHLTLCAIITSNNQTAVTESHQADSGELSVVLN